MAAFTTDSRFIREELKIDPSYNLHGVVNHYGTLGFGHYVSYTRNPFDNKWYNYDDRYREEVSEETINKESAYLLFYIRKDIENKDLPMILPNIENEYFAGKPIKLENGSDGFVLQNPPNQPGSVTDKNRLELNVKMKN